MRGTSAASSIRWTRALTLLRAFSGRAARRARPTLLGERDALLWRSRGGTFGDRLRRWSVRASVRRAERVLDRLRTLPSRGATGTAIAVEIGGRDVRARLPNSLDLAAVADELDEDAPFARSPALRRSTARDSASDELEATRDPHGRGRSAGGARDRASLLRVRVRTRACRSTSPTFLWSDVDATVPSAAARRRPRWRPRTGGAKPMILALADRRRAAYVQLARAMSYLRRLVARTRATTPRLVPRRPPPFAGAPESKSTTNTSSSPARRCRRAQKSP